MRCDRWPIGAPRAGLGPGQPRGTPGSSGSTAEAAPTCSGPRCGQAEGLRRGLQDPVGRTRASRQRGPAGRRGRTDTTRRAADDAQWTTPTPVALHCATRRSSLDCPPMQVRGRRRRCALPLQPRSQVRGDVAYGHATTSEHFRRRRAFSRHLPRWHYAAGRGLPSSTPPAALRSTQQAGVSAAGRLRRGTTDDVNATWHGGAGTRRRAPRPRCRRKRRKHVPVRTVMTR